MVEWKTTEGLPSFRLGIITAVDSLIRPKRYLFIEHKKGPFSDEDLAEYAARCSVLNDFRQEIGYFVFGIVGLFLLITQTNTPMLPAIEKNFPESLDDFLLMASVLFGFILVGYIFFRVVGGNKSIQLVDTRISDVRLDLGISSYGTKINSIFHINKLGLHVTFGFFLTTIVLICFLMWWISVLAQIPFNVEYDPTVKVRVLSGSEWLYFFLVSFTTLGFGDISPVTYGGRLLVMAISVVTIFTVIYWYSAISKGPTPQILDTTIDDYHSFHLSRLQEIRGLLELIAEIRGEVCCLMIRKNRKGPCPACAGKGIVLVNEAMSQVVWPPKDPLWIISTAAGIDYWCLISSIMGIELEELSIYKERLFRIDRMRKYNLLIATVHRFSKLNKREVIVSALSSCPSVGCPGDSIVGRHDKAESRT